MKPNHNEEGTMKQLMTAGGYLTAVLGILVCAVAGLARVGGAFHVAGFESITLLQGGVALMVLACVLRLYREDF
jgi:hypothetical protein